MNNINIIYNIYLYTWYSHILIIRNDYLIYFIPKYLNTLGILFLKKADTIHSFFKK